FPRAPSRRRRPAGGTEVHAMADRPPVSVLYVDDDEGNRHSLTWFLEQEGFRTREASTGQEALRLAADKPDVIILDVGLPDIDGRILRCNRAMGNLFGRPASALAGLEHGALLREVFGAEGEALAERLRKGPEAEGRELALKGRWFRATADAVAGEGGPAGR